jgi:hypothetical protein
MHRETRNAYEMFTGKPLGKTSLGREEKIILKWISER